RAARARGAAGEGRAAPREEDRREEARRQQARRDEGRREEARHEEAGDQGHGRRAEALTSARRRSEPPGLRQSAGTAAGAGSGAAAGRNSAANSSRMANAPAAGTSQIVRQSCVMTPAGSVSVYASTMRPEAHAPMSIPTPCVTKARKPWAAARIAALAFWST